VSAIAASALFAGLACFATYYRFFYQHGGESFDFPWLEFWSTIAMIGGGVVRALQSPHAVLPAQVIVT
jgi:hypothetical protein